jgi:hypothetical protein
MKSISTSMPYSTDAALFSAESSEATFSPDSDPAYMKATGRKVSVGLAALVISSTWRQL